MSFDITKQTDFWTEWNRTGRDHERSYTCQRQAEMVLRWLDALPAGSRDILEVGCGAGWLCPRLARFGHVTGTDLALLDDAKNKWPQIEFVSGDFMDIDFDAAAFDVIVTLETIAHIADQPAFIAKLASHLKPSGKLMLTTQNGPVIRRWGNIAPQGNGQLRNWPERNELVAMLQPYFEIEEMTTAAAVANRGFMRIVNSHKLNIPIRALFGDRVDRLKERAWLGWVIAVRAIRRTD